MNSSPQTFEMLWSKDFFLEKNHIQMHSTVRPQAQSLSHPPIPQRLSWGEFRGLVRDLILFVPIQTDPDCLGMHPRYKDNYLFKERKIASSLHPGLSHNPISEAVEGAQSRGLISTFSSPASQSTDPERFGISLFTDQSPSTTGFLTQQDEIRHVKIFCHIQSSVYMAGIRVLWQVWCSFFRDMPTRKMFPKLSLRQKQRHGIFSRLSLWIFLAKA